MKRLVALVLLLGLTVAAGEPPTSPEAGKKAFLDVARVLQSPRCMNCHPVGDAPLQTDAEPTARDERLADEHGLRSAVRDLPS